MHLDHIQRQLTGLCLKLGSHAVQFWCSGILEDLQSDAFSFLADAF